MKWFKHDTTASTDAKLQELLLDYGATGYGVYWYCVELIAGNVTEHNITFELEHDARIIARSLNLTEKETHDIMKKMIELNLFSVSENEKLACYALAKRIDQSMTSSKHFRGIIETFKDKKDVKVMTNHDGVMTKSEKVMQDKIREDKRRLDKSKKIKQKKPLPDNLNLKAFDMWCEYKGTTYKQQGKTLSANLLAKHAQDKQMQMVENSIMNNYKGLFEIKETPASSQAGTYDAVDAYFEQAEAVDVEVLG